MQQAVLSIIEEYGPVSINDITRIMGKDAKNITGRLKELREKGLVCKSGWKKDRLTKVKNLIWSAIG